MATGSPPVRPCSITGTREGVLTGAAAAAEAAGLLAIGDAVGAVAALRKAAQAAEDAGQLQSRDRLLRLAEKAAGAASGFAGAGACVSSDSFNSVSGVNGAFTPYGTRPVSPKRRPPPKRSPSPPLPEPPPSNGVHLKPHSLVGVQEAKDANDDTLAALRLVEAEKEWLEARVRELEQQLKAQEMLDNLELEAKLAGQDSRETQALAALRLELETLKAEQEYRMAEIATAAEEREEELHRNIEGLERCLEAEVENTVKRERELEERREKEETLVSELEELKTAQAAGGQREPEGEEAPRHVAPRMALKEHVPPLKLKSKDSLADMEPASPKATRKFAIHEPALCDGADTHRVFKEAGDEYMTQFSDPVLVRKEGKALGEVTVQGDLEKVIDVLVESRHSEVYHDERGEYIKTGSGGKGKCKYSQWVRSLGVGYRRLNCTTVVQAPWTQHTQFVERQRYCIWGEKQGDANGLVLHISSMTPNVTVGEYFRCETLVEATPAADGQCRITAIGYVHFMKTPFGLKGKIMSTAYGEMKGGFARYLEMAKGMVEPGAGDGGEVYTPAAGNDVEECAEVEAAALPDGKAVYKMVTVAFTSTLLYLCSVCNAVTSATSESLHHVHHATHLITCSLRHTPPSPTCHPAHAFARLHDTPHPLALLLPLQSQLSVLLASITSAAATVMLLLVLFISCLLYGRSGRLGSQA